MPQIRSLKKGPDDDILVDWICYRHSTESGVKKSTFLKFPSPTYKDLIILSLTKSLMGPVSCTGVVTINI